MVADEYKTISTPSAGLYKDKGSRFLGFAFPVKDEEEIKHIISNIRKTHHECNHHCYAYRLGAGGKLSRSSDDREPSGSAGKPILGQLLSNELTDTLIIVARYFGGSLLGVPGLINAYREAAADAIANANVITKTINAEIHLSFPYAQVNEIMMILRSEPAEITGQEYNDPVKLTVSIRTGRKDQLIEKLNKCRDVVITIDPSLLNQ